MNPKCGSTQWRKLLVRMENNYTEMTERQYMDNWTKRRFWEVHQPSRTDQRYIVAERKVNEYLRIMTVREPLERLVSAYKQKFEHGHEKYYHQMSRQIHAKYGNGSEETATFSEFIDSILDENNPQNLNQHWKPFTLGCDPCNFNFDVIAKLETIDQDFSYVENRLHIKRNNAFTDNTDDLLRKWKGSYHEYYKNLTEHRRTKIFEYYKTQYDYFGYPYPDFV